MFKHLGPDSLTIPRQRREVFSFTAFFVLITLNSRVSRKTVCCKYSPPHFYFSPVFFPVFLFFTASAPPVSSGFAVLHM